MLSIDDVERLVNLVKDYKLTQLKFNGVEILKSIHDQPQVNLPKKEIKKVTDEDILFNPMAGLEDILNG